jgi:hypothetical protein
LSLADGLTGGDCLSLGLDESRVPCDCSWSEDKTLCYWMLWQAVWDQGKRRRQVAELLSS